MKGTIVTRFFGVAIASIAVVAALSGCGNDLDLSAPTSPSGTDSTADQATLPPDLSLPVDVSIPAGVSIPTDFTIPEETIDLMISQLEAAGMKIDKECFKGLLSDESLRKLIEANGGGASSPELIQKFLTCVTP